jgi:alcohol dehydrogenase (cytochrome c)
MRNKNLLLLSGAGVCAALGLVAFGPAALGQTPGPFTAAQVDAGRQAFATNCAACHEADLSGTNDAPQLAGSAFIGAWKGRTTQALYNKISKTMPAGAPGSLDEATYTGITAFILRANGAVPGSTAFTPTASVNIGSLADGKTPSGFSLAPPAGASAARPGSSQVATGRRVDSGRFTLPGKFGLTVKGNIQNYVPVTDEMLRNPPDGDWLMFRRNYAGWSYSPLNQINTSNVSQLQLKWMWSMPENGTMEITPMVHNGIIYVWGTGNTIQALDAKTGNLLWENRIGPAPRNPGPGPSTEETRALGLWGNYLIVNTPYGMLYALDARTGEEIWKNNIVDYKPGIGGSTGGVIVINGKVLVGMTNCGRPKTDDHCYISAYDAKTGKRDWKFVTVALKGDPGGDTWGDLPDNMRKGAETWIAGTYDPELNTTYWGVAQAKPWRRDLRGSSSGDTDYANSTLALDPDTGKMKWFFQHGPGESLDLDEVYERVLIDHGDQKTLMTIGKAGILWKLDRVTGKFIAARETVFQNIWKSIDPKTGRPEYRKDIVDQKVDQWLSSCPGPEGGHDWQATSYHQPSDTLIIPLSQSCVFMLGNGAQTYFEMPGSDGNMGRLSAYRTSDMKPLWSFQQRAPFLTGVISTAGNVAFVGDFDRVFRAVDVRNGQTLWKTRLGTTVQGFPVSFSVDGKQYVAVTTGLGGGSPELKPGTMLSEVHRPPNGYALFVFGLPDDK